MVPIIVEVANKLESVVSKKIDANEEPGFKEILSCFSTDIIGTCAFGIECNSLEGNNKEFRDMSLKAFTAPPYTMLTKLIKTNFPDLARWLGYKSYHDDVSAFFLRTVKDVVEHREAHNIKRNDFMDLLLQLKNKGELVDEKGKNKVMDPEKLTFNELAAQAFVFFIAVSSCKRKFCASKFPTIYNSSGIRDKLNDNVVLPSRA